MGEDALSTGVSIAGGLTSLWHIWGQNSPTCLSLDPEIPRLFTFFSIFKKLHLFVLYILSGGFSCTQEQGKICLLHLSWKQMLSQLSFFFNSHFTDKKTSSEKLCDVLRVTQLANDITRYISPMPVLFALHLHSSVCTKTRECQPTHSMRTQIFRVQWSR